MYEYIRIQALAHQNLKPVFFPVFVSAIDSQKLGEHYQEKSRGFFPPFQLKTCLKKENRIIHDEFIAKEIS